MMEFKPKLYLSSVDISILVNELNSIVGRGARFDKAYQMSEREFKIRIHISGSGAFDLVISPGYLFFTNYQKQAPQTPTSFAMQIRKNLSGSFLRGFEQHDFDRIAIMRFEKPDMTFFLVAELFGSGNLILCRKDMKIIGLLEWQRWKDRKLGVGQVYKYPQAGNEFTFYKLNDNLNYEENLKFFLKLMKDSTKNTITTVAAKTGLGGAFSEEVCVSAGIDMQSKAASLSDDKIKTLYSEIINLFKREKKPAIVSIGKMRVDAVPFKMEKYAFHESTEEISYENFNSFNDALDEYFSSKQAVSQSNEIDDRFKKKMEKLELIKDEQKQTIEKLENSSLVYNETGDLIYQSMNRVDEIIETINSAQKSGKDYSEIMKIIESAREKNEDAKIIKEIKDGKVLIDV